jgi:hypothetical protein
MAEFLMAPPEPVSWSLTVEQFAQAVARRWTEADVRGWGEGAHLAASAWIKGPSSWDDILIELHPNGYVIGIDARSYEAAAEVAAWWRRTVPPDVSTLWIFDRGFGGYSKVWPDTTPAEIFTARR